MSLLLQKKSLPSLQADEELTQDKITGADPLCGFTPVIQLSKEVVKCRIIGLCKTWRTHSRLGTISYRKYGSYSEIARVQGRHNLECNRRYSRRSTGYRTCAACAFLCVGVMKTCGSFAEVKKPEHALKLFIRFALAKGIVTYGLELMMALFNIVQGLISTIMNAAGFGSAAQTVLPQEIVTAVEDCGFFESIPLWAVTLIGGLFITILSFIMIMSVYGRFFPSVSLYRNRSRSSIHFCGRAEPECGQELYQIVCRRLSGGCNHRACLYHLLSFCGFSPCG